MHFIFQENILFLNVLKKCAIGGIVICVNRVHKNVAIFSTIQVIKLSELRVLQNVSHSIRAHKLCSGMQLFSRSFCNIAKQGAERKSVINHILCPVSLSQLMLVHNQKLFSNKKSFVCLLKITLLFTLIVFSIQTYVADIFFGQEWTDHRLRLPSNMSRKIMENNRHFLSFEG